MQENNHTNSKTPPQSTSFEKDKKKREIISEEFLKAPEKKKLSRDLTCKADSADISYADNKSYSLGDNTDEV